MDAEKVFITMPSEIQSSSSIEFVTPLNAIETGDRPNNMCRLCATETELVVPIFEGDGLQNGLADKIHKHLPIKVSPLDSLPLVVCYQCASTVLAWHELVQCCVQADRAMRTRRAQATDPTRVDKPTDQDIQNRSQEIIENIKTVLSNYFHSLSLEEYSQVELVCHACSSTPAHSASDFTRHVLSEHSHLRREEDISTFVKNNVTFVEALLDNEAHSDVELESDIAEKCEPLVLCPHCDSSFSSAARLASHLNCHRDSLDADVTCCGGTYTDRKQLMSHLKTAHACLRGDTTCRACAHRAASPASLRAHIALVHKPRPRKPIKDSPRNQKCIPAVCPECNKTFSNKYNMVSHLRSHAGRESHACGACGRRYSTRGNLRAHARAAHGGRAAHACDTCGERFPSPAARDSHARRHRPPALACHLCDKTFRAPDSLRAHLHMHRDVRDHECPRCGKAFRKRSHLNVHARTHRE